MGSEMCIRDRLLGELVLGGDWLAEFGQSVIVILLDVEAIAGFAVVFASGCAVSVETHHSQVAIRVRTSTDLFEKAVADKKEEGLGSKLWEGRWEQRTLVGFALQRNGWLGVAHGTSCGQGCLSESCFPLR